jgi:hypothetical protein
MNKKNVWIGIILLILLYVIVASFRSYFSPISGFVKDENGIGISGAQVHIHYLCNHLSFNGGPMDDNKTYTRQTEADSNGRFSFSGYWKPRFSPFLVSCEKSINAEKVGYCGGSQWIEPGIGCRTQMERNGDRVGGKESKIDITLWSSPARPQSSLANCPSENVYEAVECMDDLYNKVGYLSCENFTTTLLKDACYFQQATKTRNKYDDPDKARKYCRNISIVTDIPGDPSISQEDCLAAVDFAQENMSR